MIFSSAPNDFLNLKYSDELYHWGIKGQKWGIRRFQNPDGTLTPEGRKRYSISDKEYETGKKYYRGNGKYKVPPFKQSDRKKIEKTLESILKFDAERIGDFSGRANRIGGYFDGKEFGIFSKTTNPIYHYTDNNGKIALSYSKIPMYGNVYVKGSGNINDIDLNSIFKKVPNKVKMMQSEYSAKSNYREMSFGLHDKESDFQKAENHLGFDKSKGLLSDESYEMVKEYYHLSDSDVKELKEKFK